MSKEDLVKLYNTLLTIETKGQSTKIMSQCLGFIEQSLVKMEDSKPKE